jgi:hypothetical protein
MPRRRPRAGPVAVTCDASARTEEQWGGHGTLRVRSLTVTRPTQWHPLALISSTTTHPGATVACHLVLLGAAQCQHSGTALATYTAPGSYFNLPLPVGGTCSFHCFNLKRRSVTVPAGPDVRWPSFSDSESRCPCRASRAAKRRLGVRLGRPGNPQFPFP